MWRAKSSAFLPEDYYFGGIITSVYFTLNTGEAFGHIVFTIVISTIYMVHGVK